MIGANGQGKSNLLEAVELLTSLRSHRCSSDQDLISHGCGASRLRALSDEGDKLELQLRRSGGRQALRNERLLERQLDLCGDLRCVGFSALDLELVRGEPALRRQWLDRVVLQLEPVYSTLLRHYGRLLRQRSQLLRRVQRGAMGAASTGDLLDAFDAQMALVGTRLHRRRWRALRRLEPLAAAWQARIAGLDEALTLSYRCGTALEKDLDGDSDEELWRACLERQLADGVGDAKSVQTQIAAVDKRLTEAKAVRASYQKFADEVVNAELDNVLEYGKPIERALADAQALLVHRANR